jgi:hypothetical protein
MTIHYDDITTLDELETITCEDCKEWVGLELLGGSLLCGDSNASYTRCSNLKSRSLHGCPYAEEIGEDFETKCSCCDDCTGECAMDI